MSKNQRIRLDNQMIFLNNEEEEFCPLCYFGEEWISYCCKEILFANEILFNGIEVKYMMVRFSLLVGSMQTDFCSVE